MSTIRCYYEVMAVERKADDDDIRRAYKKLSLEYHPDRNHGREEEATAKFKELQNAYAVLKDPDERAWYDNHRDRILRGAMSGGRDDDSDNDGPDFLDPWKYFGRRGFSSFEDDGPGGFYGVYRHVFETIAQEDADFADRNSKAPPSSPPSFGDKDTPWPAVARFYQYWQGYSTKKSFAWKDEYKVNELPDRSQRRQAERINQGHRDAARKEYQTTVQHLVEEVHRADPRVDAEQRRLEREAAAREAERKSREDEQMARRLAQRKEWLAEAAAADEAAGGGKTIAEETEVLEQLYALREKAAAAKQQQMQATAPLLDEDGNYVKMVNDDDDAAGGVGDDAASGVASPGSPNSGKKPVILKCEHCKKSFKTEKLYKEHCNSNKHKTTLRKLGIDPNAAAASPTTPASPATTNDGETTPTSASLPPPSAKPSAAAAKSDDGDNDAASSDVATPASPPPKPAAKKNNKKNKNKPPPKVVSSSSSSSSDSDDDSSSSEDEAQRRPMFVSGTGKRGGKGKRR